MTDFDAITFIFPMPYYAYFVVHQAKNGIIFGERGGVRRERRAEPLCKARSNCNSKNVMLKVGISD